MTSKTSINVMQRHLLTIEKLRNRVRQMLKCVINLHIEFLVIAQTLILYKYICIHAYAYPYYIDITLCMFFVYSCIDYLIYIYYVFVCFNGRIEFPRGSADGSNKYISLTIKHGIL